MNKYNARKTVVYGETFYSKREAEVFLTLLDEKRRGSVRYIKRQPRFTLIPSFEHKGHRERPVQYTADFDVYYTDGRRKVIEVKGYKTRDYVIRRKLFLYKNPEIDFEEVL
jgi:hypothetical protein